MVRIRSPRFAAALAALAIAGLVSGCSHHRRAVADVSAPKHKAPKSKRAKARHAEAERNAAERLTQIGVNAYLWQAALDTVSFMPLLQIDSNGGVILTDWYVNPQTPGERMKLTVTILDRDLRADALRVAASRQVLQNGQWVDAPVAAATTQKLEDVILTHARDLRRREINDVG
jgi:hypothetical protein